MYISNMVIHPILQVSVLQVLRLRVMRLILNVIFSGVIVILAYKFTITFRFTLWLLSVMNNSIKDYYKPLLNLVGSLCSSTRAMDRIRNDVKMQKWRL